jgi:hypothetical protein
MVTCSGNSCKSSLLVSRLVNLVVLSPQASSKQVDLPTKESFLYLTKESFLYLLTPYTLGWNITLTLTSLQAKQLL